MVLKSQALVLVILILMSVSVSMATGGFYTIDVQQGHYIRHVECLVTHPALRATVQEWIESPLGSWIEIRYSVAGDGKRQALKLHNGIVALGIPSSHLSLHEDNHDMTYMELRVITAMTLTP
ncbi:MAG: hypothetical protein ABFS45_04725 [Pseudomonadota bacterium]